MWGEVKNLTGKLSNVPPTLLSYSGSVVTSPLKIASIMNQFYIDKVNMIHDSLPADTVNPLAEFQRLVQGCQFTHP